MAKENINTNSFDYVDLGLPSGTLWATMNVGADKPSDYGLYFQWGDTKGYTKDQVETSEGRKKLASDWSDYKWYLSGSGIEVKFTKYTTTGSTFELEDDAAHVHMGGNWHIPSELQVRELIDNTTSEWTKQNDVNGRLFTSKNDKSKSIFIPAAGDAWNDLVCNSGEYGSIWLSLNTSVYAGQTLYFDSDDVLLVDDFRYNGFPVRGVIG